MCGAFSREQMQGRSFKIMSFELTMKEQDDGVGGGVEEKAMLLAGV